MKSYGGLKKPSGKPLTDKVEEGPTHLQKYTLTLVGTIAFTFCVVIVVCGVIVCATLLGLYFLVDLARNKISTLWSMRR